MLAKMLVNVGRPCQHRDVGENVGERGQTVPTSRCWRKCRWKCCLVVEHVEKQINNFINIFTNIGTLISNALHVVQHANMVGKPFQRVLQTCKVCLIPKLSPKEHLFVSLLVVSNETLASLDMGREDILILKF